MTTATELITAGFREGNLIPVGKTPTTAEQTEALGVLNRYLKSMFGYVIGENLVDWQVPRKQRTGARPTVFPQHPGAQIPRYIPPEAYPPANVRLVWDGSTQTVYFPETPKDGARMALVKGSGAAASGSGTITLDGNGRTIEGSNTYSSSDVTSRAWLYRADTANWVALTTLALEDENPFPEEFDDYWTCSLAMRLAPRYGKTTAQETAMTAQRMRASIRAQYYQETAGVAGGDELIRSDQSYGAPGAGWHDPFN